MARNPFMGIGELHTRKLEKEAEEAEAGFQKAARGHTFRRGFFPKTGKDFPTAAFQKAGEARKRAQAARRELEELRKSLAK